MYQSSVKILLFLAFLGGVLSVLPLGWKTCKKTSPNYNVCLKEAMQYAANTLLNGSKELEIPPLEPYYFKVLHLRGPGGPVSIQIEFKDVMIPAIKNEFYDDVVNDNWKSMTVRSHSLDDVHLTGNYKADGKLMALPVIGEGTAELIFQNVSYRHRFDFKDKLKDGKKYLEVEKSELQVYPGNIKLNFTGLFNGNKKLEEAFINAVNSNWKLVWKEVKDVILDELAQGVKAKANSVLSKVPFDEFNK